MEVEPDWVHLGYTEDGIAVNSYFAEHPEMMLGRMEYDNGPFGADSHYTACVNRDPDFNLYAALRKAIGNIHAELTDFEQVMEREETTEEIIPADPEVKIIPLPFWMESCTTGKIPRCICVRCPGGKRANSGA